MRSRLRAAAASTVLLLACLGAAPGAVGAKRPPAAAYHPAIDPAKFRGGIDNPYFPLVPGTVFRFVETNGSAHSEDEVTVTHDTRTVMGVQCVVVHDVERRRGIVIEESFDWYAQDDHGTVWYFGEATKEFHAHGKASTSGSWTAGVAGAQPGVVMWANPKPGQPYRQEYLAGAAEDMARVVAVGDSVTVPYGSFTGCVRTTEWSALEHDRESKWYAKGVGVVRTRSSAGEAARLVTVTRP